MIKIESISYSWRDGNIEGEVILREIGNTYIGHMASDILSIFGKFLDGDLKKQENFFDKYITPQLSTKVGIVKLTNYYL